MKRQQSSCIRVALQNAKSEEQGHKGWGPPHSIHGANINKEDVFKSQTLMVKANWKQNQEDSIGPCLAIAVLTRF